MKMRYLLLAVAGLLLAGCGSGADAGDVRASESALGLPKVGAHALEVYGHHQDASGGRLGFELAVLKSGQVRDVREQPIQELVGVPDDVISVQTMGTEITSAVREARNPATDEWAAPAPWSKFDELGLSTDEAEYVLLAVRTSLDGELSEHRALEVCWASRSYCLVMDPVVQNLEGYAGDRAKLLAEGWAVETSQLAPMKGDDMGILAVCSLNSNPAAGGISSTWNQRTVTYKNLYGITVVQKTLGGQQVGISCYISGGSCLASGFGYSYASSCWANLGFNCDCDYTGNWTGITSNSARSWSETKCEHKNVFQGSANVSWTESGVGANFSISWATSGGSVDSSGGTRYETCSWH